jgi:hypothetical protein
MTALPALHGFLSELLEHVFDEIAVPHHVSLELDQFKKIVAADATPSCGCNSSSLSSKLPTTTRSM